MPPGTPDLSVIVPCYRQAHFLSHALDSALSQEGVHAEVIVVDDGPDDAVAEVCARYGERISLLRQKNAGVSAARNAGLSRARGACVHFLDADDAAGPGMYAALLRALEANLGWIAVFSTTRYMNGNGEMLEHVHAPRLDGRAFHRFAEDCPTYPGAMIVRRAALDRTGGFDPGLEQSQDWDLMLQLARSGGAFGLVPEAVFHYRQYPGGRCKNNPREMYRCRTEVLRRTARPDPRVKYPSPEFANGIDPALLPPRIAQRAALALGLALGHNDAETAAHFLRELLAQLDGRPCPPEFLGAAHFHAGLAQGLFAPKLGELDQSCAATLRTLERMSAGDERQAAIVRELARRCRGPKRPPQPESKKSGWRPFGR